MTPWFSSLAQKEVSDPWWSYRALSKEGHRYKGRRQAASSSALAKDLLKEENQLISCRRLMFFKNKATSKDQEFIDFSHHMGALLKAGFSIEESLEAYEGSSSFHSLKHTFLINIRRGQSFSQTYKEVFSRQDSVPSTLIDVAEQRGNLGEGFERLSHHLKDKRDFQNKLMTSLAYPSFLMFLIIFLVAYLLGDVVPQLESFLRSTGQELPTHSQALVGMASGLNVVAFPLFISIILVAGIFFTATLFSKNMTLVFQKLSLKFPFVGGLFLSRERLLFFENFSLLLEAGVPLLQALETAKVGNALFFQEAIGSLSKDILSGLSISQAFEGQSYFDQRSLRFLKAGEASGNLGLLLKELNSLSRRDIQQKRDRFIGSLEPAALLFVGGMLLWIVVSFFLPLYESLEGVDF